MIALLLACTQGPWTDEAAVAPLLSRLDRDGDGRVVQAEYEAVLGKGATITPIDADHDGGLTPDELAAWVATAPPAPTGPPAPPRPMPPPGGKGIPGPALAPVDEARQRLWLLRARRAELAARSPEAPLPTDAELDAEAAATAPRAPTTPD